METFTCFIQQPPLGPFNFRDLSWWVELWRTPKHDIEIDTIWKRVYVAHIPWVRVFNFLTGEENMGNVQCRLIRKDHQMNSFFKILNPTFIRKIWGKYLNSQVIRYYFETWKMNMRNFSVVVGCNNLLSHGSWSMRTKTTKRQLMKVTRVLKFWWRIKVMAIKKVVVLSHWNNLTYT
jgi:hypothetical protein